MRLAFVIVVAAGSVASAAPAPEISFQVRTPANGPPTLRATIDGGPHAPTEAISLSIKDRPDLPAMTPSRVRNYAAGDEPLALALVFNGQEIWIGDDDYGTDADPGYLGVLKGLELGLDKLELGKLGPPGSQITAVAYSTGAEVKVPLMPLEAFHASQLGSEVDYRNKIGTDMVQGISLGLRELERSAAPRKVLVVVGDGNDTNNEAARSELARLRERASTEGIQMIALIYKSAVSADGEVISRMIPHPITVNSIDGIASELDAWLERIADRTYLTFDGADLPWDGQQHLATLRIGDAELGPLPLQLPARHAAHSWWPAWWQQLLIGVGAVALLLIGLRFVNRRVRESQSL